MKLFKEAQPDDRFGKINEKLEENISIIPNLPSTYGIREDRRPIGKLRVEMSFATFDGESEDNVGYSLKHITNDLRQAIMKLIIDSGSLEPKKIGEHRVNPMQVEHFYEMQLEFVKKEK